MRLYATNKSLPLAVGLFLLASIGGIMLLSGLSLLAGLSITAAIVPLAVIMAFIVVVWLSDDMRVALVASLMSVAVMAIAVWLMTFLCDTAFDSYAYHLDTVVYLATGWNPTCDPSPTISLWPLHYAKGLELMQAATLAVTGSLQSVIGVNIVFIIATLLIVWYTLGCVFPSLRTVWRVVVVVMVASNTVVAQQFLSALNDYALWLETCLLTCGIALAWQSPRSRAAGFIIGMAVLLAVNTKFTHFFYIGLQCLFWAAWCVYYRRRDMLRRCIIVVVASMLTGVMVVGYNPYVTNTVEFGNPVYPLGTGVVDIMTVNTPAMMTCDNRMVNMAKSLLSVRDKPWALVAGGATVEDLVMTYSMRGCAVNGFGAGMVVLVVLGFVLMIVARPALRWWVAYTAVWCMAFCFQQGWWARYIPFLWLVVVMPFLLAINPDRSSRCRRLAAWLGCVMLSIMFAGAAVAIAGSLKSRLSQSKFLDYVFTTSRDRNHIPRCTSLSPALRQIVRQNRVTFDEVATVDSLSTGDSYFLLNRSFDYVIELPADVYPSAGTFGEREYFTIIAE